MQQLTKIPIIPLAAGVFATNTLWKCEWMRHSHDLFYFLFLNTAYSNVSNLFNHFIAEQFVPSFKNVLIALNPHLKITNFLLNVAVSRWL